MAMPGSRRIAVVALGLAATVYGTASLTGGWLGTPPWWERAAPLTEVEWNRRYYVAEYRRRDGPGLPTTGDPELDRFMSSSVGGGAHLPESPSDP